MKTGAFLLSLCVFSSAWSAVPEGWAAYDAGDYAQAYAQWIKAAESGDAQAEYNIGLLFNLGKGVKQSDTVAREWYEKAAVHGSAAAQNNLGVMYRDGTGVLQNLQRAFDYFNQAAEQGDAKGEFNVGIAYATGAGVPVDYAAAAGWLTQSADAGYAKASFSLSVLYTQGKGVTKDLVIADALLIQAANTSDIVRAQALDVQMQVERTMSVDAKSRAILMAQQLSTPGKFAKTLRLANP